MLLVEHKALHLYLYDAYREYSWSTDQGAYQPTSFIFLSFESFRNLCMQYGIQLIDDSECAQAQMEKANLISPYHFLGLITRVQNAKDVAEVQAALAAGKNVIALLPRALASTRYLYGSPEKYYQEALQAVFLLGCQPTKEQLSSLLGYKESVWWEEVTTPERGRLFVSTDGYLSDWYFKDGYGKSDETQQQISNLIREFSTFKYPVVRASVHPKISHWFCHELLNVSLTFFNHGPAIQDIEISLNIPASFEPLGPLDRYISHLDARGEISFTLPFVPRAEREFQNFLTMEFKSSQHSHITLSYLPTTLKIASSSGAGLLYQMKQDNLGLTTLQSIFASLPRFTEIKRLPQLVQSDPPACLNKMRIIAEGLTAEVLKKSGYGLPGDFNASIRLLQQQGILSARAIGYLHTIRSIGNIASHPSPMTLSETDV